MRTVILLGCLLIANAITTAAQVPFIPEADKTLFVNFFGITLCICILFDALEFAHNLSKK